MCPGQLGTDSFHATGCRSRGTAGDCTCLCLRGYTGPDCSQYDYAQFFIIFLQSFVLIPRFLIEFVVLYLVFVFDRCESGYRKEGTNYVKFSPQPRFRREVSAAIKKRSSSAAFRGSSNDKNQLFTSTEHENSSFFSGETATAGGGPAHTSVVVSPSPSWALASSCYEGCSQTLLERLAELRSRFELERPFGVHKPAPPSHALISDLELAAALEARLSELERIRPEQVGATLSPAPLWASRNVRFTIQSYSDSCSAPPTTHYGS